MSDSDRRILVNELFAELRKNGFRLDNSDVQVTVDADDAAYGVYKALAVGMALVLERTETLRGDLLRVANSGAEETARLRGELREEYERGLAAATGRIEAASKMQAERLALAVNEKVGAIRADLAAEAARQVRDDVESGVKKRLDSITRDTNRYLASAHRWMLESRVYVFACAVVIIGYLALRVWVGLR